MDFVCRWCASPKTIGEIKIDPYDYISGSPILQPSTVCLNCYNIRVIAALEWLQRYPQKQEH